MSRLRVVPIIEGKGEMASVRILLERIWYEIVGGEYIDVVKPFRVDRGRLVKQDIVREKVRSAALELNKVSNLSDPTLILILFDADKGCPKKLGPEVREYAGKEYPATNVACVIANVDYETWFVAAAESLSHYLDLSSDLPVTESPEDARHGKAWIKRRFRKAKYSETIDQPAMTHAMDLALCRKRSPSFDKLCREMEQRMRQPESSA
jgi:hypothetical protein